MIARGIERDREQESRRPKKDRGRVVGAWLGKPAAVSDAEIAAPALERALDAMELSDAAQIDVVAAMLDGWAYDLLGDQRRDMQAAARLLRGVGKAVRAGAIGPRSIHARAGQLNLPSGIDPHTCELQSTKKRCT
jgi:hypothetical protein